MGTPADLCQVFADARGGGPGPDGLAAVLDSTITDAASAWPELALDRAGFARFLGERIPADVDPIQALRDRRAEDLYLVFAALAGEPVAQTTFERVYLAGLADRLVRQRIAKELAADTVQQLRINLFVGPRPLLAAYSGTGDLHGWLRITALRAALRTRRGEDRRSEREQATELAQGALDANLLYQRTLYQEEFRAAFAEAVAALSLRERNLLKHSVLYGATSDDLGALYHVHRATAARWLADARDRLSKETQRRMIARLAIDRAEYDSILRLIESQLDLSLTRILE